MTSRGFGIRDSGYGGAGSNPESRTPNAIHRRYRVRHASTLLCVALALAACAKKEDERAQVQTAVVERRTIVIDAEATGVVEPINVIEV